jgi:hypothetical protein
MAVSKRKLWEHNVYKIEQRPVLRVYRMPSASGGRAILSGLGGSDDVGYLAVLFLGH